MSLKQSIPLKSVANARELGDYHTADGKTVRSGVLLRTGNLNDITAEDIQTLKDQYRLSDIIDFRMEMRGYEDTMIGGVTNTHLDVIDLTVLYPKADSNVDIYKLDVLQLVKMLEQIGMLNEDMYIGFLKNDMGKKAFPYPACGKDRTGLAAMLLLSLFGVEESVIMEDYMLTNEYDAPRIERTKKVFKSKRLRRRFCREGGLCF